jgi:hypothetical protein
MSFMVEGETTNLLAGEEETGFVEGWDKTPLEATRAVTFYPDKPAKTHSLETAVKTI